MNMKTKELFDTTIQVLDKVLELRSQKLQTISSNIANAETPGYARHKMEFEEQLNEAVIGTSQAVTHPRHMPNSPIQQIGSFQANFYREKDYSGIGDGNSVNLEQEMVDLAINQIRFEAAILSINKKFNMLKYAIQEKI
jgi:flagellar basal-body rod protein FlgB